MRQLLLVRDYHAGKTITFVSGLQLAVEFNAAPLSRTIGGPTDGMNIEEPEAPLMEARTCGDKRKRVAYKIMDASHSLCSDKKDILLAEIDACEILLRRCDEESERSAVEKEISQLKLALDLMP